MELNRKVRFSYVQKAVQLIYNVVQPIWDIRTRTGKIFNNCPFLKKSTEAVRHRVFLQITSRQVYLVSFVPWNYGKT